MCDDTESHPCDVDSQHYCNYPEISKASRLSVCYSDDSDVSTTTSSSCLPSLTSDISDPGSQPNIGFHTKESDSSLHNLITSDVSHQDSSTLNFEEEIKTEVEGLCEDYEDSSSDDEGISTDLFLYEKSISETVPNTVNKTEPFGWIKYAMYLDPWHPNNYLLPVACKPGDGLLTRNIMSKCCCKIDQLPDSKEFVLTRLHLNQLDLKDICVLLDYRYFLFVDLSWNFLTSLEELSNLNYLMYLNASHNKLKTALNMKPPWFLTHVNLSCNEITEIGPYISSFWSLRYVDLSYNLINKIDGIRDLKYLRHLDLSHNYITKLENLHCINLEELYIAFNDISDWDSGNGGLHFLKKLQILKLAHNKMSSLLPFHELIAIQKLDISYNSIAKLHEISCLDALKKLQELDLTGNLICSEPKYREFILFKLFHLKLLDSVLVECGEKVSARMLFEPDLFTNVQQMRATIELWNQMAPRIDKDTAPADQPPAPLVLLVGSFANCREDLVERVAKQFPDKVYRCKKYTTLSSPQHGSTMTNSFIQVTDDEFNAMVKEGKFLVIYKEIGVSFGLCRDEISNIIVEGKIGLLEISLEAALVIRASGLNPFMVLCTMDDQVIYSKRLKCNFMKLGLWGSEHYSYIPCDSTENSKDTDTCRTISSGEASKRDSVITNDISRVYLCLHSVSRGIQSDFGEKPPSEKSSTTSKCTNNCSIEEQVVEKSSEKLENNTHVSLGHLQTFVHGEEDLTENSQVKEHQLIKPEDRAFAWTWSFDSSGQSSATELDENYLTMLKGLEKFINNTIKLQELYVEANRLYPGLFYDTILVQDLDTAKKKLEQICSDVYNSWRNQRCIPIRHFMDDNIYSAFVHKRVSYLLSDLINVPIDI